MALTTCWECNKDVSDTAPSCPHCGAVRKAPPVYSVPTPDKKSVWPWFIGVPVGLFVLFIGYGFTIPEHKARAMELRNICEKMTYDRTECDRIYDREMAKGREGTAHVSSPVVPGVTTEMIDAALADGARKAKEEWKPLEHPPPPANLFEGK